MVSTPTDAKLELFTLSALTSQYHCPVVSPLVARTAICELVADAVKSPLESVMLASLSLGFQVARAAGLQELIPHVAVHSALVQLACATRHSPLQSAIPSGHVCPA
jgi:hypothetical protein